jgi:DNA-binding CsgD family transcriptional regulator
MRIYHLDADRDHVRLVAAQVRLLDDSLELVPAPQQPRKATPPDALLADMPAPGSAGERYLDTARSVWPDAHIFVFVEAEELGRPTAPGLHLAAYGDFPALVAQFRACLLDRAADLAPLPLPELTDREREILILLAGGHANKVIAQRLGISHRTVMNHVNNLYRKLGVNNRLEAVHRALKAGLAKLD